MPPSCSHQFVSRSPSDAVTRSVRPRPLARCGSLLLALLVVEGCGSGDDQLDRDLSPSASAVVLTGFSGNAGSKWHFEPDGDGVRSRRAALRLPARWPAARHQERRVAADAVREPDGRLRRRTRTVGRDLRPELRLERVRLRVLHGDHAGGAQPGQPLHRERRRRRAGQRVRPHGPRESERRTPITTAV